MYNKFKNHSKLYKHKKKLIFSLINGKYLRIMQKPTKFLFTCYNSNFANYSQKNQRNS